MTTVYVRDVSFMYHKLITANITVYIYFHGEQYSLWIIKAIYTVNCNMNEKNHLSALNKACQSNITVYQVLHGLMYNPA